MCMASLSIEILKSQMRLKHTVPQSTMKHAYCFLTVSSKVELFIGSLNSVFRFIITSLKMIKREVVLLTL